MWKISSLAGLGLLGAVAGATPASAVLVVDGSLADWGVTIADFGGACGTDAPGSCIGSSYGGYSAPNSAVTVGDTNDVSNSYIHIVGSGGDPSTGGGQNYDAEMLAAAVQGGVLYIGLASGQRNDNGFSRFSPGDLRIVVNGSSKYGVEIGGGAGGGPGGAITEGAAGTTYTLNSYGNTVALGAHDAAQTAGTIWGGGIWIVDPIGTQNEEVQYQKDGTSVLKGTADYVFTRDSSTSQHSIVEMSFSLSDLGIVVGDTVEFQWGPSCANDLVVTVLIPEQGDIPAPAALGLFLLGLGGLGGLAGLRRRKAA